MISNHSHLLSLTLDSLCLSSFYLSFYLSFFLFFFLSFYLSFFYLFLLLSFILSIFPFLFLFFSLYLSSFLSIIPFLSFSLSLSLSLPHLIVSHSFFPVSPTVAFISSYSGFIFRTGDAGTSYNPTCVTSYHVTSNYVIFLLFLSIDLLLIFDLEISCDSIVISLSH